MAKISSPERNSNTSWSPTWPSKRPPVNSFAATPCARSGPEGVCASAIFTFSVPGSGIDGPDLASVGHAEEFVTRGRVVAETTQHAAGDQVGAGLVDTPRRHAVMRRLDDHADALRLEHL